jgi:hypothetical protein
VANQHIGGPTLAFASALAFAVAQTGPRRDGRGRQEGAGQQRGQRATVRGPGGKQTNQEIEGLAIHDGLLLTDDARGDPWAVSGDNVVASAVPAVRARAGSMPTQLTIT